MKKAERSNQEPRGEYDFSGGVRGKYAKRFADGSNVVVLEPAAEFKTADEVNTALREAAERRRSTGSAE